MKVAQLWHVKLRQESNEPLEGTEVNVIEPHYTQADLEAAYRQGFVAGARTLAGQAQVALGALGDACVSSAETVPIPNNLRASVARMARVGQRQQPHVAESPLARPFPGNGLQASPPAGWPVGETRNIAQEHVQQRGWPGHGATPDWVPTRARPTTPPHEQVRQWPAALHSSPHHQGPRPELTIVPDPTRLDLNVPQQEHGEKKLPRR